ncbi:MAG: hypothetical protein ACOYXC_14685 [Candidatus Rifleibacteriota bacterium]
MKRKTCRNIGLSLLLVALIQITGCFGYDFGASDIQIAVDTMKRFAGYEDGIADNEQHDQQGIVIGSSDSQTIVIQVEESSDQQPQELPQDITTEEDGEEAQKTGATAPVDSDKSRAEFISVTQDPDAK